MPYNKYAPHSLKAWKEQLDSDKRLYDQSKEYSRNTTVGRLKGEYGKLYRQSLAGLRRAYVRKGRPIPKKYQPKR